LSVLLVSGLKVTVGRREILSGVDLEVRSGQVHAVMGPNGSGKSTLCHALMGRKGYEVTAGSLSLDGADLLGLPTWERAQAGLFLAPQYPTEVPGVSLLDAMAEALAAGGRGAPDLAGRLESEAEAVGLDRRLLARGLNVDLSGGERKRSEALQLGVLSPRFALLDEIDSGLDVEALRMVADRIERATAEAGLGVLAITHYSRLLAHLRPDSVHVLGGGRVVATGGPELAFELERTGYGPYAGGESAVG
jgi:Fe-S cluster assembly ATP-binding protein